jgi:hypothetical protein
MKIDCEYSLKVNLEVILPDDCTKEEIDNKIKEEGTKRLRYYLSGYLLDPDKKFITDEIKLKNTKYASI